MLLNGDRASVWEDGEVLEMDSGNGCTKVCIMPLNVCLKMVKFMLCIFYLNFLKKVLSCSLSPLEKGKEI